VETLGGNTKNKRSAISLNQGAMRASAKQLWRAVEAFELLVLSTTR
jgi:hypothetical protein